MPHNKRESLIFTVMMCFTMVFVMSIYNVSLNMGGLSAESIKEAWLGFPIAYIFAMCCDWFVVSGLAKGFAFKFLVKPGDGPLKTAICVSVSMVGAVEVSVTTGQWSNVLFIWLHNIPFNFIMALPLQLIVAGPLVRKVFRTVFPEGKVLA